MSEQARDVKGQFAGVRTLVLEPGQTVRGLSLNDELRLAAGFPVAVDDGEPADGETAVINSGGNFGGGMQGEPVLPPKPNQFNEQLRRAVAFARGEA